jgi:hypothetical protein
MKDPLIRYARAGYAGLFCCTSEEVRAEAEVKAAAEALGRPLQAGSLTTGFVDTTSGTVRTCPDPLAALEAVEAIEGDCLVLLRDFAALLEERDPVLVRKLRDTLRHAKASGKLLLLLGVWKPLPPELERELTRLDLALPGPDLLGELLDQLFANAGIAPPPPEIREAVVRAATGLTTMEAENAFALSLIESGAIQPSLVAREKAHALKSGGLLEVIETTASLDAIGGLENLKAWLIQRGEAFTERARTYGLPVPKGMLVLGVPGTGKSLTAKATASVFGVPLLKLDAGRLFGGLVGQSEANVRSVIQTAEAISPCVLWIDEIEKGFGGAGGSGGSTDGGTSARVFGTMLNWLQDKTAPVFVVATANDVSKLPPEMLRKGRWDELWFVDLPDTRERTAIWDLVIAKYGRAFAEDREPGELDLGEVLNESVPLAVSMSEAIERLRHWAKGRARHASAGEKPSRRPGRKIDVG